MWSSRLVAKALPLARWILPTLLLTGAAPGPGDLEQQVERGQRLYQIHCRNCHGDTGQGDGPMARVLKSTIPDLSRIAQRHGGTFPSSEVYSSIDGRFQVPTHGRRDMPVWGLSFQVRGQDHDQEEEVRQRLEDLVAYLRSIQVAPEPH